MGGRSKSYRDDSWDSEVTSDEEYTKKKSANKKKAARSQTSKSRPKSKAKPRRYSDDSDVEFDESTAVNKKNILEEEDENIEGNRRTRGKRTKYNLILDDSSESEAEKVKGSGKQIENCNDSTSEEYDAKEEDDDSKDKSENDSGDINDQVQINNERTLAQT